MTEADFTDLFHAWARRLDMGHWEWTLKFIDESEDDMDDAWAEVEVSSYYERAIVKFTHQGIARDRHACALTIVHELVHVLMRDLDQLTDLGGNNMAFNERALWSNRIYAEREALVDKLAVFLVNMVGS